MQRSWTAFNAFQLFWSNLTQSGSFEYHLNTDNSKFIIWLTLLFGAWPGYPITYLTSPLRCLKYLRLKISQTSKSPPPATTSKSAPPPILSFLVKYTSFIYTLFHSRKRVLDLPPPSPAHITIQVKSYQFYHPNRSQICYYYCRSIFCLDHCSSTSEFEIICVCVQPQLWSCGPCMSVSGGLIFSPNIFKCVVASAYTYMNDLAKFLFW